MNLLQILLHLSYNKVTKYLILIKILHSFNYGLIFYNYSFLYKKRLCLKSNLNITPYNNHYFIISTLLSPTYPNINLSFNLEFLSKKLNTKTPIIETTTNSPMNTCAAESQNGSFRT